MQFISISLLCQYVKKFTKNIFEKCVYFFIFGKTTKIPTENTTQNDTKSLPRWGKVARKARRMRRFGNPIHYSSTASGPPSLTREG